MIGSIRLFIRMARPLFLVGGALMYWLGAGIASYLGNSISIEAYILGQVFVTLLQLSTQFLNEYFNAEADQENPNRTVFSGGSGAIGLGKLTRRSALIAGLSCLAFLASATVVIISRLNPPFVAYWVMAAGFLGAFFYSIPPVHLESSGYGELTTSILVAFLVPCFGYLLQAGEVQSLLAKVTFPLVCLHLAMMLVFEFPDYWIDLKYNKQTLLVRIGWQRGIVLHTILVFGAYLLLALAMFFGLPRSIALPAFLSLPLALFELWLLRRIGDGVRPNWFALTFTAVATLTTMAYLMAFAFWTK